MIPLADDSYQLTPDEVYPRQALYGFQLAPDGTRLSFVLQRDRRVEEIVENGARRLKTTPLADLAYLPVQGGYPQPLTSSGDYPEPPTWSPDGRWLAVEQDGRLYIMEADGGQKRRLFTGGLYHPFPAQTTNITAIGDACWTTPRWSPDGKSLLVAERQDRLTSLRLLSVDGTWQRQVYTDEGAITSWDLSPDGRRLVVVARDQGGWSAAVRIIEVNSGLVHDICDEADYEYQAPVAAWASNRTLVLRSNRSGWSKLYRYDLGVDELKPLTNGDWDEGAFRISPNGRYMVYASRAAQPISGDDLWVSRLTPGSRPGKLSNNQARRLTQQPGVHAPLAWARDGMIYFWYASPTEPGDLWAIAAGGAPRRLTHSAPLALQRKLRSPQEALVLNDENIAIPTLIYYPAYYQKGQRYPAIVWIHGGPTMQARSTFTPYCNWLANLGFIVLVPNYRGSTGLGVAHMNAVSADGLGKHDLADVLAAGRFAETLPGVDTQRGVGVGGFSWGGYLALMAAATAPRAFSCVYAGAGISDWFIQQAGTEVRYYDRWLVGGWVYEQSQRARERSPLTFAGQIQAPLLVIHGENDVSVPYAQIVPFVDKARQAGAAVEFVSFPLEGHVLRKPENQAFALERVQKFYQRHLQPWNLRDNPSGGQIL